MEIYRRYRCDFGHEWLVARGEQEDEQAPDTSCPEGHEAVTCQKEIPADEVQIVLRPAARLVDPLRDQRILEGQYWLILLDRSDRLIRKSQRTYDWNEAVAVARRFAGKTAEEAARWWDKAAP